MAPTIVLQNVKRITGEHVDIVIDHGRIAEITEAKAGQGDRIMDYSDVYVSSGWIDLHAHAFPKFDPYGDEVDEIGVKQGVTTIVDAGSCGADQFPELIKYGGQRKTNLLAFLNISRIGLKRVDELSNLNWINGHKVLQTVAKFADHIVGLKARISRSVVGQNGITPLQRARQLSEQTALPLMVHIGSDPPSITDILTLLDEGDILTHYLHGKPNGLFDKKGESLPAVREAMKRGVHLDVGHGSASFSFHVAETAKRNGIEFDTISTDIYRDNRLNGPVYSLAHTLSKFLHLGYSLEQVIQAVTTNAARWLNKPELGRIKVGDKANLTLFTVEHEPVILTDSEGEKRKVQRKITVKGVVIGDEFITY